MNAFFEIRFTDLVHLAARRKASDIHLVPGLRPAMRVDGILEYVEGPPLSADETAAVTRELLCEASAAKLEEAGDATTTRTQGCDLVLRVHAFRTRSSVGLAIRLLPLTVPSLESLGLPPVVAGLANKSRGLLLFAGPTGSGKSTTMAALVGAIGSGSSRRIITIEDPIEFRHTSERGMITQREIGRDVPSFAGAVIGALRADPDVIVIGEMRDAATMRAALTAAETGHLVLTTLHTGDAVQTVDRIVDAFVGHEQAQVRSELASSLAAVVCQRLLPRAGGAGRTLAAELLIATDAVRATIREARTHQLRNLIMTGRHVGMQTLEDHIAELVSADIVDGTPAQHAVAQPIGGRR